jgi:hypothetical protein
MNSLCEMLKPAYIKLSPEENDKVVGVLPMYREFVQPNGVYVSWKVLLTVLVIGR